MNRDYTCFKQEKKIKTVEIGPIIRFHLLKSEEVSKLFELLNVEITFCRKMYLK